MGSGLVAAVLACASPGWAIVIRHDVADADAIVAAAGDDAVGKLLNRNRLDCTATLIAPRWVLTAAHCVTDIRHPKLDFAGQRVAAKRWFVHSKWNDNERQGFDIALVKLAKPITTITPATLYRQRDEVGQAARLVGYGDHGDGLTGATGFDAQRRAGSNTIQRLERARGGKPHVLVTTFNQPTDPDALPDEATTAAGDSGGPLLLGDAVAGITSWGSSDFSEYGDVARYTRVSSFAKWIDRIMGGKGTLAIEGAPGQRILGGRHVWRDRDGSVFLYSSPASVPEPGAGLVLVVVMAPLLLRRRVTGAARAAGPRAEACPGRASAAVASFRACRA